MAQTALLKVYRSWSRIDDKEAAGAYTRKVMIRVLPGAAGACGTASGRRRSTPGRWSSSTAPTSWRSPTRSIALATLPLGQRAVLVLRYFEGRSEAEIADLLGI